jgi:diguanylate cyclase (GGDEF)-like protein
MMFWKFQSHPSETSEPVAQPNVAPAAQPTPAPSASFIAFAPSAAPAPAAAEQTASPEDAAANEVAASYQQAAEQTMRFLAQTLQIPSWVLLKNMNGTLEIVGGVGDYERYLAGRELTIGRLSDLQTVNLLSAAPPIASNGGVDRRSGGIDPATVAPYGVPLVDTDGNLFAILCAFGERVAPQRVVQLRPLLEYSAEMLGAVVRTELTLEEAARRTERAQADALVDPLTGLHNRRAWDQLLATEDQRCSRHGYDAVIFVMDVDGLKAVNDRFGHEKGDELIKNAATALERSVRRTDVVARVGGDEFSILAVKCDASAAARIRDHIESTLMRANAPATVGFAVRSEAGDLFEAWRQADGAMYNRKRGKPSPGNRASDNPQPAQQPPSAQAPEPPAPPVKTPAPPAAAPSEESSVVAQILEKVLPALVTGVQIAPPPPPPQQAAPQPVAPPPAPPPVQQPPPPAAVSEEPQASKGEPSEDLIDIVSRLSRLSEGDRRLLDVFFKGSK